jgi:hypothetical protein
MVLCIKVIRSGRDAFDTVMNCPGFGRDSIF